MNKDLIKELILIKFGTYTKCAEELGITRSTLSRNLEKPSYKFLLRLKQIGVNIPDQLSPYRLQEKIPVVAEPSSISKEDIDELKLELMLCRQEINFLKKELLKLKKQAGEIK